MAPPVAVAAAAEETAPPVPIPETAVEFERSWQGFGVPRCTYLAPKSDFVAPDGSVDVVFHFHAGQMSTTEMKASGVRGVFVSCGYGIGTGGYSRAFEDPRRFGRVMKRLLQTLRTSAKRRDVHLGRLALVSWSAGFAALNRILSVPEWYDATDAVVLLDSLHAQYVGPAPHRPAEGKDKVDVRMLRRFVRFASDAAAGKKTMVITHSAIVPPSYASTSEATAALLSEVGVTAAGLSTDSDGEERPAGAAWDLPAIGGAPALRADRGDLHVRGFRGNGPHDHFDHLHLIGVALRSWLVPRWYTPTSERP